LLKDASAVEAKVTALQVCSNGIITTLYCQFFFGLVESHLPRYYFLFSYERFCNAIAHVQIANLRRVSRSNAVILMDSNGGTARAVAKELTGRGFGNVFVLAGGFRGWQASKLETRPSRIVAR
jgi:hypothetical protein